MAMALLFFGTNNNENIVQEEKKEKKPTSIKDKIIDEEDEGDCRIVIRGR